MDMNIFRTAMEFSSDGILISDVNGNVIYLNKAYEQTTGLKKEQILNKNLKTLMEEQIFNKAISLSVLQDEVPISIIHKYITGKSALTTANPIYDKEKKIIGVICNTRNVSELLNLRNELFETKELTKKYSEEIKILRQLALHHEEFIYESKVMENTIKLASKAAAFDSTILIHGESGTGKEVLAKFIHNESPRKNQPFIKVNCAAIPNELFESELFGYMGGSFTGASKDGKPGMFELANYGTILLDEIGELPLPIQSKLLRVIQEKEVFRVGGQTPISLDVRVLAATNKDLKKEVAEGRFREDLFFRLNVVPINIPALKERREDIPKLIQFFLEKLNRKYKKIISITDDAINILKSYTWPGNVRELENLIEYLFIMNTSEEIDIEQLPPQVLTQQLYTNSWGEEDSYIPNLNYMIERYEKSIILSTLKNYPSIRQASKVLGVHYSTLSRKIKKYNIDYDVF
ncbi:sigma 54-interacting transcriptional regulator [Tissierella sp. MB52-C2]|uniref:sigma-54 interaction domain-containing protein n=1 Tax=Tissierella sp. MB52-C2 TaxID=3070999 RepID=UPI00280AC84C|nr:sigma 54-interacting transcriptional regulator [Tissierella sp. MB52-C2]WMM25998.1 sigma 54-interacting transcriptional regulator [Tissierella sp. MB52-C2]